MLLKKKKRIQSDNAGTTLIETLAAFTVLAAILAILFHIVDFSSRLRTQAVDTAHLNQMFMREIYKNNENIDESFVEIKDFKKDDNGKIRVFWLTLDTEKTDLEKNYLVSYDDAAIRENPPVFYLDNLGATGYTCIDDLIDDEHLPRPAAVSFHYLPPVTQTPEP